LLSGKHTDLNTVKKGRFTNNPNYLPRFYDQANFQAVQLIRDQCENEGISMVEATYRWLFVHSALDETDGVLLGASSLQQLGQNLNACSVAARHDGTLSDDMVRVFDEAWEITKNSPFPYWRSFSSDMPDRENLNQGASYQAVKK
jgi:aflatoxin B1 aldehyde reductase